MVINECEHAVSVVSGKGVGVPVCVDAHMTVTSKVARYENVYCDSVTLCVFKLVCSYMHVWDIGS